MRPTIGAIGTSDYRINGKAFIRQIEYLKLQLKMRIQKKVLNLSKMLASKGLFFLSDYRATFLMTLNEGNEHWEKCKQIVNGTCLLHHLCVFFLSEYRANFLKTLR